MLGMFNSQSEADPGCSMTLYLYVYTMTRIINFAGAEMVPSVEEDTN